MIFLYYLLCDLPPVCNIDTFVENSLIPLAESNLYLRKNRLKRKININIFLISISACKFMHAYIQIPNHTFPASFYIRSVYDPFGSLLI